MARYLVYLFTLMFFILCSPALYAEESETVKKKSDFKTAVSIFGGIYTDGDLGDMFTFGADYDNDIRVLVGAISHEFYRYQDYFGIEVEGQIGYHWDDGEDYWEFVGLLMGRWHPFPWDHYVETSIAVGAGFSYYTEMSPVEFIAEEDAQRFLGALAFEMTFGLPQFPQWDMLFRIHHRSGLAGAIGEGSSNYVTGGLRYSF